MSYELIVLSNVNFFLYLLYLDNYVYYTKFPESFKQQEAKVS